MAAFLAILSYLCQSGVAQQRGRLAADPDSNQHTLTTHVVHPQKQAAFERLFAQYMYTSLTPLIRLDSPELKAALALVGAAPPSRFRAAGPLLDEAYGQAVDKVVSQIKECDSVCITMDGWKKRAAEHGTIITVVILMPNGKRLFWKVRLAFKTRLCSLSTLTYMPHIQYRS